MSGVSPNIFIHKLLMYKEAHPVMQKKRNHAKEKRLAAREETGKLLSARFI